MKHHSDVRRLGRFITEIVVTFDIPRFTVSFMHQEYLIEGITPDRGYSSGRTSVLNDRDQVRLSRSHSSSLRVYDGYPADRFSVLSLPSSTGVEGPLG